MLGRRFLADDGFTYPKILGRAQNSAMEECWQLASGYSLFSHDLSPDTTKPYRALVSPSPHQFHPQMIWDVVSMCFSLPSIPLCCCEALGPVLRGAVSAGVPAEHRPSGPARTELSCSSLHSGPLPCSILITDKQGHPSVPPDKSLMSEQEIIVKLLDTIIIQSFRTCLQKIIFLWLCNNIRGAFIY